MDQEDDRSLIEIAITVRGFIIEFKRRWRFVATSIIIFISVGIYFSLFTPAEYSASGKMMLESSKGGSSMSGALALASQFGLMSGGSSTVINEDKLIEIIKTQSIVKTALFKTATINSKSDILANHYMDIYGYNERFEDSDSLKGFRFTNDVDKLSKNEKSVFKSIYYEITGRNMIQATKSESGIVTITTVCKNQYFSKYFNDFLVEALTDFYVNRVTEKARNNVAVIQKKVDSVSSALKKAEYALARWKDGNFQLVKAQGLIAEADLRREVEVCSSIYIEAIKQLEVSKFSLLQETPFLQIIDPPTFPINPSKFPIKKAIIYGFLLGLTISTMFIVIQMKFRDIKAQLESQKH